MNRRRANWIVWSISAVLLAGLASGAAALARPATPPRTVVDYYLLLPSEYFGGLANEGSRQERLRILRDFKGSLVDTRNGYLYLEGDGAQESLTVCLFRRPDRSYLIAVNANEDSDGGWDPSLDFYLYRNGHLVNVTRSTLLRRFSKKLGYKLPRYGTTIKVITEAGETVYELPWVNGRFRVRRV